jgi:hypothetical protein
MVDLASAGQAARGNHTYPWDEFCPEEYFEKNYRELRPDDRKIIGFVRDFFQKAFSASPRPSGIRGIDVGTGANLYPALTMLPFCESITLFEYSAANIAWLTKQRAAGWPSWDQSWREFWQLLCEAGAYQDLPNPKEELSRRVHIQPGDVFELSGEEPWDVGTMFFVAESITDQRAEFLAALDHFFAMLKPNAPFAMAFMEHSHGYRSGGRSFPATDVGENDIARCLQGRAVEVETYFVEAGDKPLRTDHTGMILAHGRVVPHRSSLEESS